MLAGEARGAVALHQAGSGVAVGVPSGLDTDVAGGLLHDDGEDDTGARLVVLLWYETLETTYRSSTPILADSLTAFQMRPMSSSVSPVAFMEALLALKISSNDFHWSLPGKLEEGPA